MYQKWPSKSSILSRVSPGHLYYLFLDSSPTYVSTFFCKNKIWGIENLKIPKPRFTNKCPVLCVSLSSSPCNTVPLLSKRTVVNLGFWIFRFSDFRFSRFFFLLNIFENMLVRYRGINNKGVLDGHWTKWRVLRAISITLKCQFTAKC